MAPRTTGTQRDRQLFGGGVSAGGDLSRNYQLDYHEAIGSPSASRSVSRLAGGLTYYNEGHFSGHHRDGYAAQLWLRSDDAARTRFAFGVGPYWYFDTALAGSAASHRNIHGVGLLWSAMASYDLNRRWFAAARNPSTRARGSAITTSPSDAKLAATPPIVGLVSTEMNKPPAA